METQLRKQLLDYLEGRHAHALLHDAVKGFPIKMINAKPQGVPYSCWELLEHIRRTQDDILEFVTNPGYKDKDWPEGYWPKPGTKANKTQWDKTLKNYQKDFRTLLKIIKDPKTDLFTPLGHGQGQTIFREAMLVLDHTSYHTGELIVMRRALGIWEK